MSMTASKWPGRLIVTIGVLFVLFVVIHFAGIATLRYFVERELHPALLEGTHIGEVHLNLLSGRLEIEDFRLHQDDQLRMRLGDLLVDISPWRLVRAYLVSEGAGQRQARACRPRIDDKPDGQPRADIRF